MARPAGSTSSSSRPRPPRRRERPQPTPRKSLGQHFLTDRNILRRIADAAGIDERATVVEVGAGPGDLTAELATRAARVFAIEIDRSLCRRLRERFAATPNVIVVEQDALDLDASALTGGVEYVVVGNLPYNAGTAIVRRLLEAPLPPRRLVVMLQKEVALSMLAPPGDMGLLAVSVQVYATGRRLFDVPAGAFHPPPKVTSSVVRLELRPRPLVPASERASFFRVVRGGFSAPRKQLRNALANGLDLEPAAGEAVLRRAGIDPRARPGSLSLQDWLRLAREFDAPQA
jgi:16S rRNA (adenine1518-N6/adenine1519-N6)-dimethyltransferase